MQTAAILWHVSLLVPADRKALALGLVGLVRVVPDHGVLAAGRCGGRCARPAKIDDVDAVGNGCDRGLARGIDLPRTLGACGRSICSPRSSSAAGSFDGPARQSLIPNLVPREHLPNAISLNTIMLQTASVRGPVRRRTHHRARGCRLGLCRQRRVVRLRHCRARDDASHRESPAPIPER